MNKGIPYTCQHCNTKQVFHPTDTQAVDLLENRDPDPAKQVHWPVCPKCGQRNRITPGRRKK